MVNYANGKVYKIEPSVEHEKGEVYYGATTKVLLSQRMTHHTGDFRKGTNKCTVTKLFFK